MLVGSILLFKQHMHVVVKAPLLTAAAFVLFLSNQKNTLALKGHLHQSYFHGTASTTFVPPLEDHFIDRQASGANSSHKVGRKKTWVL